MSLFNLSLRVKLPLLGAVLIVLTALALSASFLVQTWDALRKDMLKSSGDLGQTMARPLFQALLHDNVWGAYETVSLPFNGSSDSMLAESVIVVDVERRVFAASHPERFPVLNDLKSLGSDYASVDRKIAENHASAGGVQEYRAEEHTFILIPVESDSVRLGTLIVAHNNGWIWQRFEKYIERAVEITLLILAVLLPINWYWGRRMVAPLRLVTDRLRDIGQGEPAPLDPALYPYRDEVGDLYRAYGRMLRELEEKGILKREVVNHERMAAIGRLTASIAHEINNPLGGMLNAISTLKRYGNNEAQVEKTVRLLERGLSQIRETVAALLVEAKITSRRVGLHDLDDIRLLVAPEAHKRQIGLDWQADLPDELALPSTPVRQLLMNLALNAIHAAGEAGRVAVRLGLSADGHLSIRVENDGDSLSPEQRERLFEPFTRFSEHGNGLGLWVCYQIVTQLNGEIRAESETALTRFIVTLPQDDHRESENSPNLPD